MTDSNQEISKIIPGVPEKSKKLWDQWSGKKQYNKADLEIYYRIRERNLQWLTSLTFSLLPDRDNLRILKTDLWNEAKKDERYFVDAPGNKFGLDISNKICRMSQIKYAENLHLAQGSIESMPFRSDVFDLIWDISTIDHCDHPETVLSEYKRVLKSGRILLLVVENLLCISYPVTKIQSLLGYHVPFKGYLSSDIIQSCRSTGFEIVDHFKTNVHLPRFIAYSLEKKGLMEGINQGRNFLWDFCKKYSVILCRKI